MSKPRILFIMHMPPPVHGPAVMGALIRDSRMMADAFECRYLNLSASDSLEDVGKGSLRKLRFLFRLLREERAILRSWKPDLVYVTPTSTLPSLWKDFAVVRMARGTRLLLHFHNKGVAARSSRWLDDLVYRKLFADAGVILLSEALLPDVEKYVPAGRVSICPNGLDFPVCEREAHSGVPQLLFLSNLLPGKGIVDLLDACALLRERGVAYACHLVGNPSAAISAADIQRLVSERGLEDYVSYDGPKYGPEKAEALSKADVFVHPTREDCFPLVILEAMAVGLPVVSTLEGAIPDEVEDGVTGLLCPKRDPLRLSEALERLLMDPSLRERMGAAGRERYQERFTGTCFEKRLTSILQSHV